MTQQLNRSSRKRVIETHDIFSPSLKEVAELFFFVCLLKTEQIVDWNTQHTINILKGRVGEVVILVI